MWNDLLFQLFHPEEGMIGEGAFYALFGFVFVFLGISLLILIFTGLGLVMKKWNERGKTEQRESVVLPSGETEEIPPEIAAVISAAIAAYYEEAPERCAFVVKRIKRL